MVIIASAEQNISVWLVFTRSDLMAVYTGRDSENWVKRPYVTTSMISHFVITYE